MQTTIPAVFHGIPLQIIDHAGQQWLTAEQVGRCLGYNEANTRQGVHNLYTRHADEFTGEDTCVIKSMTNSRGNQSTRAFSRTGCYLLGMFANTPRAKEFRVWAKTALAGASAPVPAPAAQLDLARELGALRDELRAQNGLILDLYGRLDGARRGHLRALTSLANIHKRQSAQEAKALVLALAEAGVPRDEIARRTGKTLNHIRQILYRARHGRTPEAQGQLTLEG